MHHVDANPFESPPLVASLNEPKSRGWSTRKYVALALVIVPFVVAFPLNYWMMNYAPSWVVATDIDARSRFVCLRLMYLGDMACLSVVCVFGTSLLLWCDRWHPRLTGILAVCLGVLMVPALFWIWVGIDSYLTWG